MSAVAACGLTLIGIVVVAALAAWSDRGRR